MEKCNTGTQLMISASCVLGFGTGSKDGA